MFFPLRDPKRFKYFPRYHQSDSEEKRLRFRRITLFDPHRYVRVPRLLVALLLLVVLLLYLLGGPSRKPNRVLLTEEDVAGLVSRGESLMTEKGHQ